MNHHSHHAETKKEHLKSRQQVHHHHHSDFAHKHFHPRVLKTKHHHKNHLVLDNDGKHHHRHLSKKERNLLFTFSWDANEKRFTQRQIFQQLIRKGINN